jgi:hypothetical protein
VVLFGLFPKFRTFDFKLEKIWDKLILIESVERVFDFFHFNFFLVALLIILKFLYSFANLDQ